MTRSAICCLLAALVLRCASSCLQGNATANQQQRDAPAHAAIPAVHQRHPAAAAAVNDSGVAHLQIPCILAASITYGLKQAVAEFATRQRDPHLAHALRHLDADTYLSDICPKANRTHHAAAQPRHLHASHDDSVPQQVAHAHNCSAASNTTASGGACAPKMAAQLMAMWRAQEARIRTLEARMPDAAAATRKRKHHQRPHTKAAPSVDAHRKKRSARQPAKQWRAKGRRQ